VRERKWIAHFILTLAIRVRWPIDQHCKNSAELILEEGTCIINEEYKTVQKLAVSFYFLENLLKK